MPGQVAMLGGVSGIGLHPSFACEIVFHMAAVGLMWRYRDRLPGPGDLFICYVTSYAVFRFGVEFVQGNEVLAGDEPSPMVPPGDSSPVVLADGAGHRETPPPKGGRNGGMRDDNQPPPEEQEPPEPALGPMGFGILLGATALYAIYVGVPIAFGGPASMPFLTGPSAFIPVAVYLLVAIVLAVQPRTSRWGAGLLIALGIFTLLGGGVCVGTLAAQTGS
jgi:hypothetical protein